MTISIRQRLTLWYTVAAALLFGRLGVRLTVVHQRPLMSMLRSGLLLFVCVLAAPLQAQDVSPAGRSNALPPNRTGADVYRAACVTCHGVDGKGSPRAVVGFTVPLPDFSDCAFASAEPDPDWHAVVHRGGPIRGLDRHMPAFGEALSPEEIALAIGHVRTFCAEPGWPRGDLNLPRAFFTEKAFPENEAVLSASIDDGAVSHDLVYERRIGDRNQVEMKAPIHFRQDLAGSWTRGLGDVAVAFKRTLYANVARGGIASAALEVVLPTGSESRGMGSGDTVLEPFAMWGQILSRNLFMQFQGGAELPLGSSRSAREAYVRSSFGATVAQDDGFGRAWSPQIELLWTRPKDGRSEWDLVPQVQVTLSTLQHVSIAAGVRIPLAEHDDRPVQVLAYVLWDWFDGGFFEFWK